MRPYSVELFIDAGKDAWGSVVDSNIAKLCIAGVFSANVVMCTFVWLGRSSAFDVIAGIGITIASTLITLAVVFITFFLYITPKKRHIELSAKIDQQALDINRTNIIDQIAIVLDEGSKLATRCKSLKDEDAPTRDQINEWLERVVIALRPLGNAYIARLNASNSHVHIGIQGVSTAASNHYGWISSRNDTLRDFLKELNGK